MTILQFIEETVGPEAFVRSQFDHLRALREFIAERVDAQEEEARFQKSRADDLSYEIRRLEEEVLEWESKCDDLESEITTLQWRLSEAAIRRGETETEG